MSQAKYEVEHVTVTDPEQDTAAMIAILTGLPLEEVWERLPPQLRKSGGWYGRDFIATFRGFGYNCSPRFVPFDPATPYPCLLRYGPSKRLLAEERQQRREATGNPDAKARPWWNVVVYYDGLVYDPCQELPWPFSCWDHSLHTPSSMMQVWVSDL